MIELTSNITGKMFFKVREKEREKIVRTPSWMKKLHTSYHREGVRDELKLP